MVLILPAVSTVSNKVTLSTKAGRVNNFLLALIASLGCLHVHVD